MSIEVSCSECKQKMVNSVLEHNSSCSANNFKPHIDTDYLRPPATVLTFGSKEEQAEWLSKLKTGGTKIEPTKGIKE